MEFEWNLDKEQSNIKKHGHTFSEAVEAFQDPKGVQLVDHEHSGQEDRFYWIGKTSSGKIFGFFDLEFTCTYPSYVLFVR